MTFSVTNQRNDSTFVTQPGETILSAALRDNRIYPYGCRNGACGACKSTLVSGRVDYGNYEPFTLTDEEKAAGKVLLCQAIPLEDVVVDVAEVTTASGIQIKMLPCRVRRIERVATDVMRIFLALPKTQEFNFIPGQYIDIVLKDGQRRSFSLANLPEEVAEQGLEIHVRHVPDGHFTPRVFSSMKERDLLRFEGPFGTYFLHSEPDARLLMIAGGTGFSPIKGLIQTAMQRDPEQSIHLFWGARDQQDLYMDALLKSWVKQYPGLRYTPVLSDNDSPTWDGETGFVHQAVCRAYDDVSGFDVYASGPPIMVDSVRDSLLERGLDRERFYFDSFEFAPPNKASSNKESTSAAG